MARGYISMWESRLCDPCKLDAMHIHGEEGTDALNSLRGQDRSEGLGG